MARSHQPSPTRPRIQSGFLSSRVDQTPGNPGKSPFYPVGQKTRQGSGPRRTGLT